MNELIGDTIEVHRIVTTAQGHITNDNLIGKLISIDDHQIVVEYPDGVKQVLPRWSLRWKKIAVAQPAKVAAPVKPKAAPKPKAKVAAPKKEKK